MSASRLAPLGAASPRGSWRDAACRLGERACACVLVGSMLSGPGAMLVVSLTRPQPAWRDARTFAESYHGVQTLPYLLGFLLVGGFVALLSGLHGVADRRRRPRAMCGLAFGAAGAGLVFQNYVLQTTFVPHLARHYASEYGPWIAALSMSNPASLAWGLEMWGYGLLGVATLFAAPVLQGVPFGRAARFGLVVNGWMSVAGALWTAAHPGWVMSTAGLLAFAAWNVVAFAMAGFALAAFRQAGRGAGYRPREFKAEAHPTP